MYKVMLKNHHTTVPSLTYLTQTYTLLPGLMSYKNKVLAQASYWANLFEQSEHSEIKQR